MTELFGLPAHPLLVHMPVVFAPLVMLLALATVLYPPWRRSFGWLLLCASVVMFGGMVGAANSGQRLEKILDGLVKVDKHAALGERTRLLSFILVLAVLAFVFVGRWADGKAANSVGSAAASAPRWLVPVVGAVMSVLSVLVVVWSIRTGHEGAKAVWDGVIPKK